MSFRDEIIKLDEDYGTDVDLLYNKDDDKDSIDVDTTSYYNNDLDKEDNDVMDPLYNYMDELNISTDEKIVERILLSAINDTDNDEELSESDNNMYDYMQEPIDDKEYVYIEDKATNTDYEEEYGWLVINGIKQ